MPKSQVSVLVFDLATFGGCRITGTAEILQSGELCDSFRSRFAAMKMKVNSVVRIMVEEAVVMPTRKAGSKG